MQLSHLTLSAVAGAWLAATHAYAAPAADSVRCADVSRFVGQFKGDCAIVNTCMSVLTYVKYDPSLVKADFNATLVCVPGAWIFSWGVLVICGALVTTMQIRVDTSVGDAEHSSGSLCHLCKTTPNAALFRVSGWRHTIRMWQGPMAVRRTRAWPTCTSYYPRSSTSMWC